MKNRRLSLSILLLVTTLRLPWPSASVATDWPQWRGINRDGLSIEKGLLQTWPSGGPELAWKVTGLGLGYSAPALVGDRIFTMGDRGGACYVIALDRANGQEVWSAKLDKSGAPGWGGFAGPRGTVTTDGPRLYALGQWGELLCLDLATGREQWRKSLTNDFNALRPEWGFSESPLVDGDKVLCTPGGPKGTVLALDKNTGSLLWRSHEWTDPAHYSSLVIAQFGGVRQYVQLTEKSVAGVAAQDGKLLWRANRRGATAVIPTPIVHEDYVYVSSGYGIGCHLFKITKAGETFGVEQVYANKVMANHHGGVIQLGQHLYGYSEGKGWTCQDLTTGQALWQEKKLFGKGSLAYADGRFYLRFEEGQGTVALIQASPEGYKELGRFDQPDRSDKNSWSHPVIADGKLYLRDQELLLCYNIRKP